MFTRAQLQKFISSRLHSGSFPADDARQIVMHALNCSHSELISHPEKKVSFFGFLFALYLAERRKSHTPMAYLIGRRSFYGRDFCVRKGVVLIPRPETEILVDEAIALKETRPLYIDVGTGSGAIAVTLAAETGQPAIGTDISIHAVRIAIHNADRHHVGHLTDFREGALLHPIQESELSHANSIVITANLPYLNGDMLAESPKEVRLHEPAEALFSDNTDGLGLYRYLFEELRKRRDQFPSSLNVIIEIDPRQEMLVVPMIRVFHPSANIQIKNDLAGKARVVIVHL